MGSIVLLDLMGGVALLLWGLHMVLSGVLRAFGPDLRRILGKALDNRLTAFAAGLGLTALLQSSTATGLMTATWSIPGRRAISPPTKRACSRWPAPAPRNGHRLLKVLDFETYPLALELIN